MNRDEAIAFTRELFQVFVEGGDLRASLKDLFNRHYIPELTDDLRDKSKVCEAQAWIIVALSNEGRNSVEIIAGRDVLQTHNSNVYLVCCEALHTLLRKSVYIRNENPRWGMRDECNERYELLTHDEAVDLLLENRHTLTFYGIG
jgi:hypothetical protein